MSNPICSQCGSMAKCYCHDIGGTEFYIDEYILYCDFCGYIEVKTKYGGAFCGKEYITYCSFCGEVFWKHNDPPKELQVAIMQTGFNQ